MAARSSKNGPAIDELPDVNAVRALRRRLLGWYAEHHRKLPWRPEPRPRRKTMRPADRPRRGRGASASTRSAGRDGGDGTPRLDRCDVDPYYVLVSEAMLQQTRVATVLPYFARFVGELPTLRDLAEADEQTVLRLWQGLGYYRRARNLHAAAKACIDRFGGRVPEAVDQLLSLPGVGRYTAGAIASIAHGVRAPILDGNVARVLARLFAIGEPIDQTPTRNRLWAFAECLVPANEPGHFNQAMMELGATICTPRDAKCMFCPVRSACCAFDTGRVDDLPKTTPRKQPKAVTHHVLAVERGGKFLFEQRPNDGLWSAMWQSPTAEVLHGTTLEGWARERLGLVVESPRAVGAFKHQTTHRTIRFEVSIASVIGGRLRRGAGAWRSLRQVDDLPLSNPQRRVVEMLMESG